MGDTTTWRPGALVKAGALAAVVSVVLNHLVLQAGALALFEIPHDFQPLHGPGPVVFFSVIGAVAGVGAGVGTLMLMHVVSAAVVVWAVERSS